MENSFLSLSLVYLGAAVLVVPLLKRLGLSSVLGYLLAGVLIGPFALGLIGDEGGGLMHVAEFGVVMMLFLIGLELNPQAFWKMRHQVLGYGSSQLIGTTVLLWLVFWLMQLPWNTALAIALAFTMSSTAIVMQGLKEKGLLGSATGKASFSVLLFQDIAVIPILAILPLLVSSETSVEAGHGHSGILDSAPGWLRAVLVIGSVAGVYIAGTYVVAPVLRFISKTGLREMFTASALLLVVAVAFLMETVGLSPALGAFVAGVVLANSEFRHELESDIEPFKGLLLGLFFMSVGVSINFALLSDFPAQIAALVLMVMVVKASVLWAGGKVFRLSNQSNLLFALGLCQVGEFAFVLMSLSNRIGLVSPEWLGKLNAVVAISMILTPLLLIFHDKFLVRLLFKTGNAQSPREHDEPDLKGQVIIAGFGHFGSTVGRVLQAGGIAQTVLDADADQVQMVREFGHRAFFGDATRHDLLHIAGIHEAGAFIAATGSPQTNLALAKTARKMAPHIKIFVRAENRLDAYDLIEAGFVNIYRETLHTSVLMGVDILTQLGIRESTAKNIGRDFANYDEGDLPKLAKIRHDRGEYASRIRELIAVQEELLQEDIKKWNLMHPGNTDADGSKSETI